MSAEKTRVDLERVLALKAELAEINALDLEKVELYVNGQPLVLDPESVKWWKFTGLGSSTFFESLDPQTGSIPITEIDEDDQEESTGGPDQS
jgi:hypothetical protein